MFIKMFTIWYQSCFGLLQLISLLMMTTVSLRGGRHRGHAHLHYILQESTRRLAELIQDYYQVSSTLFLHTPVCIDMLTLLLISNFTLVVIFLLKTCGHY